MLPPLLIIENIVTFVVGAILSAFIIWWTGNLWGLMALVIALLNMNYLIKPCKRD